MELHCKEWNPQSVFSKREMGRLPWPDHCQTPFSSFPKLLKNVCPCLKHPHAHSVPSLSRAALPIVVRVAPWIWATGINIWATGINIWAGSMPKAPGWFYLHKQLKVLYFSHLSNGLNIKPVDVKDMHHRRVWDMQIKPLCSANSRMHFLVEL